MITSTSAVLPSFYQRKSLLRTQCPPAPAKGNHHHHHQGEMLLCTLNVATITIITTITTTIITPPPPELPTRSAAHPHPLLALLQPHRQVKFTLQYQYPSSSCHDHCYHVMITIITPWCYNLTDRGLEALMEFLQSLYSLEINGCNEVDNLFSLSSTCKVFANT